MGPIGCAETSVRNYHTSLRNSPEQRSSHSLRGRSLKYYKQYITQCCLTTIITNLPSLHIRLSLIRFSQRRLVRFTESNKYQRSAKNVRNNYPPDLGYRRDDRSTVVRLPAEDVCVYIYIYILSFLRSEFHPASCSVGARESLPMNKAAGV
jgi:hypothetical protein